MVRASVVGLKTVSMPFVEINPRDPSHNIADRRLPLDTSLALPHSLFLPETKQSLTIMMTVLQFLVACAASLVEKVFMMDQPKPARQPLSSSRQDLPKPGTAEAPE